MEELEFGNKFLLALDTFGQQFNFRVHHKFTSYKTICGTLLTILMLIPLIPFAIYKYNVMLGYGETNIIESLH
jgi:hypothetical protein